MLSHVRRTLGRGLLLVLPLLITLWLLSLLFNLVDQRVTPLVIGMLRWTELAWLDRPLVLRVGAPLIGIVLTAAVVYLLGALVSNLVGRRVVAGIENGILRIPLIKGIYGSARQLLDAFSVTGAKAFSSVVIVEYPRRGLWTVGFVTSEVEHRIRGAVAEEAATTVAVFLPTTPNPTSGWMLLVPLTDLLLLDMTIEDGIKLVVSGGIVTPEDLGRLARPWHAARGGAERRSIGP